VKEDAKPIKRVCSLLQLKRDKVDQYLEAHQVWPELLQVMHDAGMRNFSMFLKKESGQVVLYFEAEDPQESLRQVSETDVSHRWEESMAEYFEDDVAEAAKGGGEWLEQYFYLD
jgi:L-rhamnose mutarotase